VTAPAVVLPEVPAHAAEVFGAALPAIEAYAALLAGPGTERGLLGPRETPRLWERHLLNCAGLSELIEDGQVVLDLGSGAGLPGIVLALQRPEVQVVLVESLQRRATFLTEVVEQLALRNVLVRRARAEELAGKLEVDVVTARAVAPVDRLAGWALPLLHLGGRRLALKGEEAGSSVVEVGTEALGTHARVVVVARSLNQAATARPTARPTPRAGGISGPSKRKDRR
jgi:16S rRNA (guanine527-N7)-methyltransferase